MPNRVAVLRAELATWRAKVESLAQKGDRALRSELARVTAALDEVERGVPGAERHVSAAMRALMVRYREIAR